MLNELFPLALLFPFISAERKDRVEQVPVLESSVLRQLLSSVFVIGKVQAASGIRRNNGVQQLTPRKKRYACSCSNYSDNREQMVRSL